MLNVEAWGGIILTGRFLFLSLFLCSHCEEEDLTCFVVFQDLLKADVHRPAPKASLVTLPRLKFTRTLDPAKTKTVRTLRKCGAFDVDGVRALVNVQVRYEEFSREPTSDVLTGIMMCQI